MISEIYKQVNGFEGFYEVSNLGNIRSIDHYSRGKNGSRQFEPGRVLKLNLKPNGYIYAVLSKYGISYTIRVHRAVAEAFLSKDHTRNIVNHKNGVKHDNRADNLEWVTTRENSIHSNKVLGRQVGVNNSNAKPVLHLQTGIYFDTLKEACTAVNANYKKVSSYLSGSRRGKTDMIYV